MKKLLTYLKKEINEKINNFIESKNKEFIDLKTRINALEEDDLGVIEIKRKIKSLDSNYQDLTSKIKKIDSNYQDKIKEIDLDNNSRIKELELENEKLKETIRLMELEKYTFYDC